jgi:hypothetical protein
MKIPMESSKHITKLLDWYFHLTPSKKMQMNYMVVIVVILYFTYKNNEQHRENYNVLSVRIDSINNARSREQRAYTKNLEFYTEKFSSLLEKLLIQKEEIKQIKEKK